MSNAACICVAGSGVGPNQTGVWRHAPRLSGMMGDFAISFAPQAFSFATVSSTWLISLDRPPEIEYNVRQCVGEGARAPNSAGCWIRHPESDDDASRKGPDAVSEVADLYEQVAVCDRCDLARGRNRAVPGEGPEDAGIMFIGEAPGFHEDRLGRPFVGAAGHFLEELLASIGLRREDVYIANVIKCRPPQNRDPLPSEIETCSPWLDRQIELIKPRVIITLGRFSMARYFPGAKISRIHGRPKKVGATLVIPMYHPAAALHQPRYRADIERDFAKIPQILAGTHKIIKEEVEAPQGEQLSLF